MVVGVLIFLMRAMWWSCHCAIKTPSAPWWQYGVLVGRSPETEHSMSNWIKQFFHIWVGVKEAGGGKQRTQVGGICTDCWWLLVAGTDRQQEIRVSCTWTTMFRKHYIREEEEVKTVFPLSYCSWHTCHRGDEEQKMKLRYAIWLGT